MKKSFALVFTNIILFFLIGCSATPYAKQKINGVSFVSSRDTLLQTHIDPVLRIHRIDSDRQVAGLGSV